MLQKWSVITKDHQGHVVLGRCKQRYRIAKESDQKVLKILVRYIQVADILAHAGVPRCLVDWEQEVTSLALKMKETRVQCFSGDYGLRWLLRTKWIVNMRVPLLSSIDVCLPLPVSRTLFSLRHSFSVSPAHT